MNEKTVIKFMNKLGVSHNDADTTTIVAGGNKYTITVEEIELPTLGDRRPFDLYNEVCDSIKSPITKAWFIHNNYNICMPQKDQRNRIFSNKVVDALQTIDTIISRRTADTNALAILVYVELMNVDIRIDKVVDYFESIDIAKELQQYVSESGIRDNIPLPLTKFLRNDTSKTLVTPVAQDDIIKISEYGDPLLLHVVIEALDRTPAIYPYIKHMILVDCVDEVSNVLWARAIKCDVVPGMLGLVDIIGDIISTRIRAE